MREALGHRGYMLLTIGFFVCGFQVVFVGVHLPAYLADKGLAPHVAVTALALIGLFNIAARTWPDGSAAGCRNATCFRRSISRAPSCSRCSS